MKTEMENEQTLTIEDQKLLAQKEKKKESNKRYYENHKKVINEKYKEYKKNYLRDKYLNDAEFKEKHRVDSRDRKRAKAALFLKYKETFEALESLTL